MKTALRGVTVTFPSPFRHSVSLTIAASASTLNTDLLTAVFHVLVLHSLLDGPWDGSGVHKRQKLCTPSKAEKQWKLLYSALKNISVPDKQAPEK